MRGILLLILCSFIAASSVGAVMVKRDLEDLTRESDLIVIGNVVSMDSQQGEKGRISTYVSIKVEEYVKGKPREAEIVIVIPGGTVGELSMWVSEAATFTLNERNLLFLDHLRDNLYQLVGGAQGKLTVEKGRVCEYEMPLAAILDRIREELQ